MPNSTLRAETLQNSPKGKQERLCGNRVKSLKPRANALDLSTLQALNMLSSTSWVHLNTLLRGVESCWVKFETSQTFRSTRLNISFVSRPPMRGSTKSSAFAQQRSTCWAHARSAQRIQGFSAKIQHEPMWNIRTAQHVESLLRSFEHRAQRHLNKHLTCWELVQLTNPVHLHAALSHRSRCFLAGESGQISLASFLTNRRWKASPQFENQCEKNSSKIIRSAIDT